MTSQSFSTRTTRRFRSITGDSDIPETPLRRIASRGGATSRWIDWICRWAARALKDMQSQAVGRHLRVLQDAELQRYLAHSADPVKIEMRALEPKFR